MVVKTKRHRKGKKRMVVLVMAAYNEGARISQVVDSVSKYVDKIIVVDDGSTDNTSVVVNNKKAVVLRHRINLGQGAALQTGFDYAKVFNPSVVITYDADGQFKASDIPKVIRPIIRDETDVVLGSRFMGHVDNITYLRKLILKAGVLFTYIFSQVKLTDTHNGFRAFNMVALNRINITQNRMAHASEIIDQVVNRGVRYIEMPVSVKYDQYSKSKKNQSNMNSLRIVFNMIFSRLY